VKETEINDFRKLSSIFPNLSEEFEDYMKDNNNLTEGEHIDAKKIVLGILCFSDKHKKYGKHYFKRPLSTN
jgi:hypothetical protein